MIHHWHIEPSINSSPSTDEDGRTHSWYINDIGIADIYGDTLVINHTIYNSHTIGVIPDVESTAECECVDDGIQSGLVPTLSASQTVGRYVTGPTRGPANSRVSTGGGRL